MSKLRLETQQGTIVIKLLRDTAPATCELVAGLTQDGLYRDCGFYRAEKGFCVQAGLRAVDGTVKKNPRGKVPLEYAVPNRRGTVAMARWDDPASGDGEWFINLGNNTNLDRTGSSGWALGFCVWGEVVEGLEVADAISQLPSHKAGGMSMLNSAVAFKASIE
ncbi:Peptidyl-prolyl cis-trans isomerase A [Diplonema papillatum]|nr:Peptidyl-prolyl cis-trans isomerase A [Diplonema papillatum]